MRAINGESLIEIISKPYATPQKSSNAGAQFAEGVKLEVSLVRLQPNSPKTQ